MNRLKIYETMKRIYSLIIVLSTTILFPRDIVANDNANFIITVGELEMSFSILSEEAKTCELHYEGVEHAAVWIKDDGDYHDYENAFASVTIPSQVNGYKVTRIGAYALSNRYALKRINIPETIESIGVCAFRGSGLTSVEIPDKVTIIDDAAFALCENLSSIKLPNSLEIIGEEAFESCRSLNSISIPNGTRTISKRAFAVCSNLASIVIPNSVYNIGEEAFSATAWYNNQPEGVVYAGMVAYKYKGIMEKGTSLIFKEGCKGIADKAFINWRDYIVSVTIPEGAIRIGEFAFKGTSGLQSVSIPSSVNNIGQSAFSGTTWYKSQPDGVVYAGKVAYMYKGDISENTTIVLKEGCTGVGDNAFLGRSSLTSITLPESVSHIGKYSFMDCNNLERITSYIKEPYTFERSAFLSNKQQDFSTAILYVPLGTKSKYLSMEGWKEFKSIVEMDKVLSGDADRNGQVNYADAKAILVYITGKTSDIVNSADANGDGVVDITDVTWIIRMLTTKGN